MAAIAADQLDLGALGGAALGGTIYTVILLLMRVPEPLILIRGLLRRLRLISEEVNR